MVTQVAIKVVCSNSTIIVAQPKPFRHADLAMLIHNWGIDGVQTEGFLNDAGRFLTRTEAMLEATRCGQPLIDYWGDLLQENELFSENLW